MKMMQVGSRLAIAILMVLSNVSVFAEIVAETEAGQFTISAVPASPTTSTVVGLQVVIGDANRCFQLSSYGVMIDSLEQTVDISLSISSLDFGICPFSKTQSVQVGVLPHAGEYTFSIYDETSVANPPTFSDESLLGTFGVSVSSPSPIANPEVPQAGSIQSGIGVIRGWACDASSVKVQFDDMPPIDVAYGSSRADTEARCGDSDNGYGMVFAWGLLGHGMHRMKTYINGMVVSDVEFEVVGLPEPFVRGLSGTYELESFPQPGQSVTIRWSEPDQNFIIIGHNQ